MTPSFGQNKKYTINLSKPGTEGILKIDVYNASISVRGYDGENIEFNIIDKRKGKDRGFGNAEAYYNIVEDNNFVIINNRDNSPHGRVKGLSLELKVPKNFSVNLSTYFGPEIQVSEIKGEIEVDGYFTDITVDNAIADVVGSTNHGDIGVTLSKVIESKTYYMSSYKGNVHISLPKDTDATLLIDNYFGKYQSDFQLNLNAKATTKTTKFIRRDINGGGPEIQLINYFGDIFIRSK